MHLLLRAQSQRPRRGHYCLRLAIRHREQPVEALQTTVDVHPFDFERAELPLEQTRPANVAAMGDQYVMSAAADPITGKPADYIAPHHGLSIRKLRRRRRWHTGAHANGDG